MSKPKRGARIAPTPKGGPAGIPCTYAGYPDESPEGFTVGTATRADLKAAGFDFGNEGTDPPGTQPLEEMLLEGAQAITPDLAAQILRNTSARVLRDKDGAIVAMWDEGRWWTPVESDAFFAQLMAEL